MKKEDFWSFLSEYDLDLACAVTIVLKSGNIRRTVICELGNSHNSDTIIMGTDDNELLSVEDISSISLDFFGTDSDDLINELEKNNVKSLYVESHWSESKSNEDMQTEKNTNEFPRHKIF